MYSFFRTGVLRVIKWNLPGVFSRSFPDIAGVVTPLHSYVFMFSCITDSCLSMSGTCTCSTGILITCANLLQVQAEKMLLDGSSVTILVFGYEIEDKGRASCHYPGINDAQL